MKKALVLAASLVLASTSFAVSADDHQDNELKFAPAPQSSLENLCYLKAESTTANYHYKASLYGISRHTLERLEERLVCPNGKLLGKVENNWIKRNPQDA